MNARYHLCLLLTLMIPICGVRASALQQEDPSSIPQELELIKDGFERLSVEALKPPYVDYSECVKNRELLLPSFAKAMSGSLVIFELSMRSAGLGSLPNIPDSNDLTPEQTLVNPLLVGYKWRFQVEDAYTTLTSSLPPFKDDHLDGNGEFQITRVYAPFYCAPMIDGKLAGTLRWKRIALPLCRLKHKVEGTFSFTGTIRGMALSELMQVEADAAIDPEFPTISWTEVCDPLHTEVPQNSQLEFEGPTGGQFLLAYRPYSNESIKVGPLTIVPGTIFNGSENVTLTPECPLSSASDGGRQIAQVTIKLPDAPTINNAKTGDEITNLQVRPVKDLAGLTPVTGGSVDVKTASCAATFGDRSCIWIDSINVELLQPIVIYIASEYAPDSCNYSAVKEHELKHDAIARSAANEYAPKIRTALEGLVLPTKDLRTPTGSLEETRTALESAVSATVRPIFEEMLAQIRVKSAQLDASGDLDKTYAKCPTW
jgi:hypothetical protein